MCKSTLLGAKNMWETVPFTAKTCTSILTGGKILRSALLEAEKHTMFTFFLLPLPFKISVHATDYNCLWLRHWKRPRGELSYCEGNEAAYHCWSIESRKKIYLGSLGNCDVKTRHGSIKVGNHCSNLSTHFHPLPFGRRWILNHNESRPPKISDSSGHIDLLTINQPNLLHSSFHDVVSLVNSSMRDCNRAYQDTGCIY